MAAGALCTIRPGAQHAGTCGSRPTTPTRGSYRTEENVVEAGGHGVHLAPGGAAPLLLQPALARNPEQQQQHEEEEGAADRGRHQRGHRPVPCGPWGT